MSEKDVGWVDEAEEHWLQVQREPPEDLSDESWARIDRTLDELMAADVAAHRPSRSDRLSHSGAMSSISSFHKAGRLRVVKYADRRLALATAKDVVVGRIASPSSGLATRGSIGDASATDSTTGNLDMANDTATHGHAGTDVLAEKSSISGSAGNKTLEPASPCAVGSARKRRAKEVRRWAYAGSAAHAGRAQPVHRRHLPLKVAAVVLLLAGWVGVAMSLAGKLSRTTHAKAAASATVPAAPAGGGVTGGAGGGAQAGCTNANVSQAAPDAQCGLYWRWAIGNSGCGNARTDQTGNENLGCVYFNVVFFASASTTLSPTAVATLSGVLPNIQFDTEDYKIQVTGYADNVGGTQANVELSQRRALSVARWLTDHGVSVSKVTTEGRGERDQIPGAPQVANRRVEIAILAGG